MNLGKGNQTSGTSDCSIYLTDMGHCIPREYLSEKAEKGRWRLVEYETDDLKGVMILTNPATAAPNVIYPSDFNGWYAVSLGLWDWAWNVAFAMYVGLGENTLKIKLTNDTCFTYISKERADYRIEEFFWKYADLTNQDFVIGQQSEGYAQRACLAYIRLRPLSKRETQDVMADRSKTQNKRLIAFNDAWSWIYATHPRTREEIYSQVDPYRDTDFGKLMYEYGFPGFGELAVFDADDFPRLGEYYANDSVRVFKKAAIEPLQEVVKYGHQIGLEVYASHRLGIGLMPPPYDLGPQSGSPFYLAHPELRCSEKDGTKLPSLSYAFPAVRDHVISAILKTIEFGVDGEVLLFHRGPPFVAYEPSVVRAYIKKYGEDPRNLSDTDERWLRFRSMILVQFLRDLGEMIRKKAKQLARPTPHLASVVFPTWRENLRYGLDVETWVKERLVDYILPRDILYATFEKTPVDVEYFVHLVRGTGCKFYPMLGDKNAGNTPETYRRNAIELYRRGVDGIAFWDTFDMHKYAYEWTSVRRLGHVKELNRRSHRESSVRSIALTKLGGLDVTHKNDPWYFV
jgi:hypothetical protein